MHITVFRFLKEKQAVFILILSLTIGLFTFREYGVTTDELIQYSLGRKCYEYVFNDNHSYLEAQNKEYGVAFQLFSHIVVEKIAGFKDPGKIILSHHLLVHLLFLAGAISAYFMADMLFKNKWLALAAFLFILLNPRLYAHSFFNPKDIPFLSMFFISLYLTAISFYKDRMLYKVLSGFGIGILINIRIMGIMLLGFVVLFYLAEIIFIKEKRKTALVSGLILISTAILTIYVTWPFLWTDPIRNFMYAFQSMSKYPWGYTNLYFGKVVDGPNTDWYFGTMWFLITVPVLYIILGLSGMLAIILKFFKDPLYFLKNEKEKNLLLFLGCFISPFVAIIVFDSVLYNGWRQLYFVYAPFVFLMIYALDLLFQTKFKKLTAWILVIFFLFTGYRMINLFPHNQVFFNLPMQFYPKEYLRKHMEMDYWGASYKQGLEYILKTDTSPRITVAFERKSGLANVFILPVKDRKRLIITNPENATYFISNYRFHPQDYTEYKGKEVYAIQVMNNTILSVFKLR